MRHLRHSAAPAAAVLTAAWLAAAGAPHAAGQEPADADAVRALYVSACASCHGTDGRGNPQIDAPVLAGLSAAYLEQQLHGFRLGYRGSRPDDPEGGEMRPMVAGLDDDDFAALGTWLASRPLPESGGGSAAGAETSDGEPAAGAEATGDPARGQTGYAACAVCHGRSGEGNEALGAARLAGQAGWYTVRQLHKFIDGVRGSQPDDASGASMRASVADLDPGDVPDIVAWIETLHSGR